MKKKSKSIKREDCGIISFWSVILWNQNIKALRSSSGIK